MSDDYRRGRKHGWIQAGILLGSVVMVTIWAESVPYPRLTDDERRVLIEEKFTPVEVVKEVRVPVEIEVPIEVPIREVVEIRIPGEPVEVIQRIEVPSECPPVGPVTLLGGCEAVVVGRGDDLMAKGRWWAKAHGPDRWWEAEIDRELEPGEITWQIDREATGQPKWRTRWWAGAVKAGPGYGPMVAWSVERRRWAAQVAAGVAFGLDGYGEFDSPYVLPETQAEVVGSIMVSRKK